MELPVSVPSATIDRLAETAAELPPLDPAHVHTAPDVRLLHFNQLFSPSVASRRLKALGSRLVTPLVSPRFLTGSNSRRQPPVETVHAHDHMGVYVY